MYIYVALAEMCIYTHCSLVSDQTDISQDLKLPAGTKTFNMMSEEDEALLNKSRPWLMKALDLKGSDLLEQLGKRNALQAMQIDLIKVPYGNLIFGVIIMFWVFANYIPHPRK